MGVAADGFVAGGVDGFDGPGGGTTGLPTEVAGRDVGLVVATAEVDGADPDDDGAVVVVVWQMTIGTRGVPPSTSHGGDGDGDGPVVVVVEQTTIGTRGVPPSTSHGADWARAVPGDRLSPITRASARRASSRVAFIVDRWPSAVRGVGACSSRRSG
jgi:hypothetical protein